MPQTTEIVAKLWCRGETGRGDHVGRHAGARVVGVEGNRLGIGQFVDRDDLDYFDVGCQVRADRIYRFDSAQLSGRADRVVRDRGAVQPVSTDKTANSVAKRLRNKGFSYMRASEISVRVLVSRRSWSCA